MLLPVGSFGEMEHDCIISQGAGWFLEVRSVHFQRCWVVHDIIIDNNTCHRNDIKTYSIKTYSIKTK